MKKGQNQIDASIVREDFQLPYKIEPGRYNENGERDAKGRLFIGMGSGIVHMWAVLREKLAPGQMGSITFNRTFGSYALTGNFSEWMPGPGSHSPHAILRKRLGDPLGRSPLTVDEGEWINYVSVYEHGPDQAPTQVEGREVNSLLRSFTGDLWIASDYTAKFHGMDFKQFGILGYDHNTGKYHASWVKSAQSNLSIFEGSYDAASETLTLEGNTRNCFGKTDAQGVVFMVKERRVIRYPDRDTRIMEVSQEEEPGGRWVRRDKIISRRRKAVEGGGSVGNVPYIGAAPMMLVSLQRGKNVVRVIGQNIGTSSRHAAAGMVMLGPEWNWIFTNDLRLSEEDLQRSGPPPQPPPA